MIGGKAYAQEQITTGQKASTDGTTEKNAPDGEIVVTAQRREERLVDVPVSVSAVSGQVIANLGINQAAQLKNIVPSLEIVDAGPIPKVGLRGIALNDFGVTNESPIAVYANDVYIGSPVSPLSQLFDVNRVEVLRGPQGTLFGRNATGGLIQIITNGPTADYSGNISLQYGSFNQVIIEAHQNIPLSDAIRTRTAFIYNHDDGWQKNLVTGTRLAKTNLWGVRETVDVDLSDSITNRTVAHYGKEDSLGSTYAFRGTRDPVTHVMCSPERIVANECVTSDGFNNPNPNPHDIYSSLRKPQNYVETYGVDNTLKYSTAAFNLTSITAYESTVTTFTEDDGATANPLFIVSYHANRKQISQELRADGEVGNLKWVGGVYYCHEKLPDGYITAPNLIAAFGTTLGLQNQFTQVTDSIAGFGQVDYKILPNVTLTGGIRYSHEKKKLTITDDFASPNFINTYSPTTSKITSKAGAKWQIQEKLMAYASVSTGFKSAAFNTSLVVANQAVPSKPEENTNYEIGFKGETDDHKWQGSIAAFYTDYTNFQLITIPASGLASILINAPKADIYGIEAELTARPFGGLSVTGNVTKLKTKIHAPGILVSSTPIDGEVLPLAPRFSAKAIVRYDVEANDVGTISPWFDISYRTTTYGKLPTALLNKLPGYALVDTGVTWTLPNKRWKLDFLVQNATDKDYYTNATLFSGMDFVKFGKVRTFAVKASTNW